MALMTSQNQISRYAAAASSQFGCESFHASMVLSLAKRGEGVGTRYYNHSLKKKTFRVFVPFLPVTASKVKISLNHSCCRRAGIAHFNQVVKSHC